MTSTPSTPARKRETLVARFRFLNRQLADASLSESDANALRRERDQVQAEIEAHDAAEIEKVRDLMEEISMRETRRTR